MRAFFFILALIVTASCGGVDLNLNAKPAMKKKTPALTLEVREKYHHFQVIKKQIVGPGTVNEVVVNSLLLELELAHPELIKIRNNLKIDELSDLRKNPKFLSRELTVEHLAHREAVKLKSSRSASLSRL